MEAFYIILTGSLIAISCGLLGAYLILRKMAMLGDAISHAVLPGIVLAFLISGSRENLIILMGAAIMGVLTTVIIELLHQKAKLQEDASIGVTFTWLFAIGVILVSSFTGQVDLDQECVLYGEIAYVSLDPIFLASGKAIGPRAMWITGGLLLIILISLRLGYKALFLTTFNADYALALGISASFWHYAFMGLVSLTTVISFESVGAILVVALLITPPAAAYLLTNRLKTMLWLTALFGVLSSIGGYYLALLINGSIAGAMATFAGLIFAICFIYSKFTKSKKASNISRSRSSTVLFKET